MTCIQMFEVEANEIFCLDDKFHYSLMQFCKAKGFSLCYIFSIYLTFMVENPHMCVSGRYALFANKVLAPLPLHQRERVTLLYICLEERVRMVYFRSTFKLANVIVNIFPVLITTTQISLYLFVAFYSRTRKGRTLLVAKLNLLIAPSTQWAPASLQTRGRWRNIADQ